MASHSESKVDENEVTSGPHHRRNRDDDDDDDDQLDSGFPLVRQSSIYSLTLDEIQNTVCEPGKGFGSMNMDEFISNIWSVEDAGFDAAAADPAAAPVADVPSVGSGGGGTGGGGGPPLHRQGSLTVPAPLCRKTVDEVWAAIRKEQQVGRGGEAHDGGGGDARNARRQPTFGEMTLEDFLIKAGVVREGLGPSPSQPHPSPAGPMQQSYGMLTSYPMGTGAAAEGFGQVVSPGGYEYHHGHHYHPVVGSEGSGQHGKRYGNGYGGGMQQQVRVGSPVSPVSSDGLGGGHVENGKCGGGMEVKMNGRKRASDRGVEKVVERRQRRMIKNRESAARSRARKQAYTVELEAELNQLKEENSRLREEERRAQALRKQMIVECMAEHAQANVEKALRSLRRCNSVPW